MKKFFVKFLGGVAIVSVLCAASVFGGEAKPTVQAANGTITVSAQASVKVKPDMAYIDIGLQTFAKDAATAQSDNAKQFDALITALKKVGVKDEDVKTSNYYVYPEYDYTVVDEKTGKTTDKVSGYRCGDTVTITVNNIDDVAKIADTAGQNGATQISGIRFTFKDSSAAYEQALEKAYAAALKRASVLAKAAGVTLGAPISIQENSGNSSPVYYGNVKEMAGAGVADSGATQLYTSDLDVNATVTVTFGY